MSSFWSGGVPKSKSSLKWGDKSSALSKTRLGNEEIGSFSSLLQRTLTMFEPVCFGLICVRAAVFSHTARLLQQLFHSHHELRTIVGGGRWRDREQPRLLWPVGRKKIHSRVRLPQTIGMWSLSTISWRRIIPTVLFQKGVWPLTVQNIFSKVLCSWPHRSVLHFAVSAPAVLESGARTW